jgi:HSP90 family molecular chaperone
MIDTIDEYLMQNTKEYKTKTFINVINDDLKLKTPDTATNSVNDEICMKLKEVLGSKIDKVVVSTKLVSQPAIVSSGVGISANMERILKAQALGNDTMMHYMGGHKVLEINPEHKLIIKLKDSSFDVELASLVLDMGMLAGGYHLENMNEFLTRVYDKL